MNSSFLFEKLENSQEFLDFKEKYTDSYLCSGFFEISLDEKALDNRYHFDFYVPSLKKTFSFELEDGIKLVELERNDERFLQEVPMDISFDFDELQELILKEMEVQKISNKIQKMIFSLQTKDKKEILYGTVFLSGLALLRLNISLPDKILSEFEKKSFFDMMKIVKK
jgi:hypothetical protein